METNKTPTNPENIYKIKYVKTSESFILTVPDPLDPTNAINATATDYELVCLIRRAIGVSKRAKFFERKACFAETACGSMLDEFAENRESTP
jgi:hypothetical protein